jgi:hypothetical protein
MANVAYIVTFIGAIFILSDRMPTGAKISLFGVEGGAGALPQQIIAVMIATMFGLYATVMMSAMIVNGMLATILKRVGGESWGFWLARFDAAQLWIVAIDRKRVGYVSPRRHLVFAALIWLVVFGIVFLHAAVVLTAVAFSFWRSQATHSVLLIVFGGAAVSVVAVSILAIFAGLLWKIPYRLAAESESPATDAQH